MWSERSYAMSNNNYVDYANIFCDSVDTIIKKRLEGISFDRLNFIQLQILAKKMKVFIKLVMI